MWQQKVAQALARRRAEALARKRAEAEARKQVTPVNHGLRLAFFIGMGVLFTLLALLPQQQTESMATHHSKWENEYIQLYNTPDKLCNEIGGASVGGGTSYLDVCGGGGGGAGWLLWFLLLYGYYTANNNYDVANQVWDLGVDNGFIIEYRLTGFDRKVGTLAEHLAKLLEREVAGYPPSYPNPENEPDRLWCNTIRRIIQEIDNAGYSPRQLERDIVNSGIGMDNWNEIIEAVRDVIELGFCEDHWGDFNGGSLATG